MRDVVRDKNISIAGRKDLSNELEAKISSGVRLKIIALPSPDTGADPIYILRGNIYTRVIRDLYNDTSDLYKSRPI